MANQPKQRQNFNDIKAFLAWVQEKNAGEEKQYTITWRPHGLDDVTHTLRKDKFDHFYYYDFLSSQFMHAELHHFPDSLINGGRLEVVIGTLPRLKSKLEEDQSS